MSRRQIAASTGLPRETVRRRIAALLARGHIVAVGPGVRVRPGLLEDSDSAATAQTLPRAFARPWAQVTDISRPSGEARTSDPNRVTSD